MARLGQMIRTLRAFKGMSQSELSKRSGISRQSISYYESCRRKPTDKHIDDIAKALGTTSEELKSGKAVIR